MAIPFTRPAQWPDIATTRFAATIRRAWEGGDADTTSARRPIALLGLPDDTGVRLNGGRPGAAEGPRAFRAALARFGAAYDLVPGQLLGVGVLDAGDVVPAPGGDAAALAETHLRVEAAVASLAEAGYVIAGIGGGHDLTLPCIATLAARRGQPLGGVNLDAHLDVRERVGSGMPFRRLISEGHVDARAFVELGLGRFANDEGDVEWARAQGATLVSLDDVLAGAFSAAAWLERALAPGAGFVSIDLDGIDASAAPGVSAPSPLGLRVEHAAQLAEAAGRDPRVLHFDVMELSPPYDHDGRTARVAAMVFLTFLAGFRTRPA
jgi:formimidoylglutamase